MKLQHQEIHRGRSLSLIALGSAHAQTKLKWAHVYEIERAVSHGRGVGGGRDQQAHQRPLRRSKCSRPRRSARKPTSTRA